MKNLLKEKLKFSVLSAIILTAVSSCSVRDDYPVFEEKEELIIEDVIPPDNDTSPVTHKIQNGTSYFKTFLIDSTKTILSGVEYTHLRFISNIDQKVSMHIVEIDRSKGDYNIQALSPFGDYLYATNQETTEMMKMNERFVPNNKQLVAAIVGGTVGTSVAGKPSYTYVQNDRVISTNTTLTYPAVGVLKSDKSIKVLNTYSNTIYPVTVIQPANYSQLISGTNWMLYHGHEAVYSTVTKVARTAIGFTEDMSKIYLIAVDGVNAFSDGITLNDFRTVFKSLGCHSAFYTNGSGSNALAVKSISSSKNGYDLKSIPTTATSPAIPFAIGIVGNK
jgi:exopolysaccharide biosynthesis protein